MDTSEIPEAVRGRADALQWSHDLSAMDTSVLVCHYPTGASGFNGAMTSQPWILQRSHLLFRFFLLLQGSHDLSAMDTLTRPMIAIRIRSLQWSHDLSAMDT